MSIVWPSGGAFAVISVPIVPPAPPRLSITTCCPRPSASFAGDEPRDDVVAAAGRKGNDEADRPGRIGVGCDAGACSKGAQKGTNVKR